MPRFDRVAILLVAGIAIGGAGAARTQSISLPPELRGEIAAALAEKDARTPAQRKIGSSLLFESRLRRGLAAVPGIAALRTGVTTAPDGTTLVDLRADATARLLAEIAARGGTVLVSVPRHRAIRARLPLDQLEAIADLPEVSSIRPAGRAFTRKIDTSEGDVAHRADAMRASFGVDGTGISVGVLSDGVDSLASLQASGDLPPGVTVLPGQAGSGDEGSAMLEIVHDLAPGAALLFATAFNSQASFAANIQALRNAGADVIVDDVGYFAESVFQDDDVAAAVDAVVADGALYFSAAGNEGNLDDGTAGVWEGDFVASGSTLNGHPVHSFGGGQTSDLIVADSPYLFTLHWSDANGAAADDYDLFLLNSAGTAVLAASTNVQNGNDDPFEAIDSTRFDDTGRRLLIVQSAGAGRDLHLNANRGRLAIATAGQTSGHAGARGALGVAAVDVRTAAGAGGVFDGSESVETYSSDGPRRVFYEADGTPITPGDFSSTGGELRQKPDLAAADCVSTAAPGFSLFCGTSAAAPHAAAVAALLLDLGRAGVPPAQIRAALTSTGLDIEAPGADRDSGAGIVDAFAAATALGVTDCSNGIDDDGDGFVDLADPGCTDAGDRSEKSPLLACDDGIDNDGDGLVDFGTGPTADPGCPNELPTSREDPACSDGIDNDGDGAIDYPADPQCKGPWGRSESPSPLSCGLGSELALTLPLLARLERRRRRDEPGRSRTR